MDDGRKPDAVNGDWSLKNLVPHQPTVSERREDETEEREFSSTW